MKTRKTGAVNGNKPSRLASAPGASTGHIERVELASRGRTVYVSPEQAKVLHAAERLLATLNRRRGEKGG